MAKMNSIAFAKMIMHAAKYPHCSVNGVLLGKLNKGSDSPSTISDCVPLFHVNLALLPSFEIALSQIEALCADKDMVICGYYHMNSVIKDDSPDVLVLKMMEKLTDNCGDKVLLYMVENHKLNSKDVPYKTYEYKEGKLIPAQRVPLDSGALEYAMNFVNDGAYGNLVDFDNHLDNIKLDWRNQELISQ